MVSEKNVEHKLFLRALIVRLTILLLVILFANILGTELNPSASNPDDRRYEAGAINYSETASKLIDVGAFANAYSQLGDPVGNHMFNWFEYTPLWYWIVCVLLYVFKSIWSVRLFNILLAALTTVYIYKFSCIIGTEKMARRAANLFTYLPYPVIFSCFAYKDQFVMFCFMYLLYYSTMIRERNEINSDKIPLGITIIKMIIMALTLLFMRGGVGAAFCLFIAANSLGFNKIIGKEGIRFKHFCVICIIGLIGLVVLAKSYSLIRYKLLHYLVDRGTNFEGKTITLLTIDKLTDIYKLPFTYIFSVVMPIGMFRGINSWYDILANINIVMVPIAIGSTLYIFKRNKADRFVYWCMMVIYSVSIVTSINIFRHYYSLLPVSLIAFSDFTTKESYNQKMIVLIGSIVMAVMLVVFYAL